MSLLSTPNCPPHRTLCPPSRTVHFRNVCVYLQVECVDIVDGFIQPSDTADYIYWKTFLCLMAFRLRSPRLFARGIRGRKLSGISVQFGLRQAQGPPSSGSKAPQV
jgi:hypothetical protein